MGRNRWVAFAVLPAGTLVAHAFAYGVVGDHARLGAPRPPDLACWMASVAAAAALAWFALSRDGIRSSPRLVNFLCAHTVLFVAQEILEDRAAGRSLAEGLGSPMFHWGLALQVVVGAAVVLLVRLVAKGGARLRAALARPGRADARPRTAWLPVFVAWFRAAQRSWTASERGPPHLIAGT